MRVWSRTSGRKRTVTPAAGLPLSLSIWPLRAKHEMQLLRLDMTVTSFDGVTVRSFSRTSQRPWNLAIHKVRRLHSGAWRCRTNDHCHLNSADRSSDGEVRRRPIGNSGGYRAFLDHPVRIRESPEFNPVASVVSESGVLP